MKQPAAGGGQQAADEKKGKVQALLRCCYRISLSNTLVPNPSSSDTLPRCRFRISLSNPLAPVRRIGRAHLCPTSGQFVERLGR